VEGDFAVMHDARKMLDDALPDLSGDAGEAMYRLVAELYPICRSITGDGVRETLSIIGKYVPLQICEVPTGLQVLDWTVPQEWNIRDAYIKNSAGQRVIDFRRSNLHVVSYSVPVHARLRLAELKEHLFSDPDHPEWIPYRTSYYRPTWGFCLSHNQLTALPDDEYEVCIDSSLTDGHLTYGELLIAGRTSEEILVSCHVCHPSLCNDNLSGIAVATALARHVDRMETKYSYRFLFVPATIGSITWLALRKVENIRHGFVLACVGDRGGPTYKSSRREDAEIDRVWRYVLGQGGTAFQVLPFSPYGYDERQFCSPGFNLPVGCFMRTPFGKFPEYHTSADNLDFVCPESLKDSLQRTMTVVDVLETNARYVNQKPYGEPRLGDLGLYDTLGGKRAGDTRMALLWLLNMSDGERTVLDIAVKSGLPWEAIKNALCDLKSVGLLSAVKPQERDLRQRKRTKL
jgi:aminopeptidase-like protein